MLQTDDVDDDFFTPTKQTTLASIFGSSNKVKSGTNPTLKYVAPKAEDLSSEDFPAKPSESLKTSECLFAYALFAYELIDGNYVSKGKLGFAIMQIQNLNKIEIRLVLYNSTKSTLSVATLSSEFEMVFQRGTYIIYNDDYCKKWCLTGSNPQELAKLIKELQEFEVKVKIDNGNTENPIKPIPKKPTHLISNLTSNTATEQSDSDIEPVLDKKSKASIVNRMAMVGQSILPTQIFTGQNSDSSDTNDYNNHHKIIRHKPVKNNIKKNIGKGISNVDYSTCETVNYSHNTSIMSVPSPTSDNIPIYSAIKGQLVPVMHTVATKTQENSNSESLNTMLSEQRISNSEMRINMSKMDFKLDQILEKTKLCESKNGGGDISTFTTDIYKKLLGEYENKIRDQSEKIIYLEGQLSLSKSNLDFHPNNISNDDTERTKKYELKIQSLEAETNKKAFELESLKKDYAEVLKHSEAINNDLKINFDKTVKGIMNNTFHMLSENFEDDKQYTGEEIKRIVAATIKKLTLKNISK